MAFDYKKEYKEFYLPPRKPGIVTVPPMNFVSVQGRETPMNHVESIRRQWSCCMALPLLSR